MLVHGETRRGRNEKGHIPVALATAVLLDLFGIGIGETVLAKVLGNMFDGDECAVFRQGTCNVGLVVELVRASHYKPCVSRGPCDVMARRRNLLLESVYVLSLLLGDIIQ